VLDNWLFLRYHQLELCARTLCIMAEVKKCVSASIESSSCVACCREKEKKRAGRKPITFTGDSILEIPERLREASICAHRVRRLPLAL
jgi:hypothetical protein